MSPADSKRSRCTGTKFECATLVAIGESTSRGCGVVPARSRRHQLNSRALSLAANRPMLQSHGTKHSPRECSAAAPTIVLRIQSASVGFSTTGLILTFCSLIPQPGVSNRRSSDPVPQDRSGFFSQPCAFPRTQIGMTIGSTALLMRVTNHESGRHHTNQRLGREDGDTR